MNYPILNRIDPFKINRTKKKSNLKFYKRNLLKNEFGPKKSLLKFDLKTTKVGREVWGQGGQFYIRNPFKIEIAFNFT